PVGDQRSDCTRALLSSIPRSIGWNRPSGPATHTRSRSFAVALKANRLPSGAQARDRTRLLYGIGTASGFPPSAQRQKPPPFSKRMGCEVAEGVAPPAALASAPPRSSTHAWNARSRFTPRDLFISNR